MKNVTSRKIQPHEVRGYAKICPEVRAVMKKMGWKNFRPAAYLLALELLEAEGNFTPHLDNILFTLSDISPTSRSNMPTITNVIEKAEIAGTIRKTSTTMNGKQQYALTAYGREVIEEIRSAVAAFAELERKLPGGRYIASGGSTKTEEIKALTKENERLSAVYNQQVKVIREQDVRIHELEMLVASLTRP